MKTITNNNSLYLLFNNSEINELSNFENLENNYDGNDAYDYIEMENDYSIAGQNGFDNCIIFQK